MESTAAPGEREAGGAIFEQMAKYHPEEAHWYLPLIGVDPAHQRRGHGDALMRFALEQIDREKVPAYLESSNPRNLSLYRRHGFEELGTIQFAPHPRSFRCCDVRDSGGVAPRANVRLLLALFGPHAMSDLSPECVLKRTSASQLLKSCAVGLNCAANLILVALGKLAPYHLVAAPPLFFIRFMGELGLHHIAVERAFFVEQGPRRWSGTRARSGRRRDGCRSP